MLRTSVAASRALAPRAAALALASLRAPAPLSAAPRRHLALEATIGVGLGIGAVAGALITRYRVAKPDEYVVRTGLGIDDIEVSKKAFQWPFQTYKFVKMEPRNYHFELKAITKDYVQFILPMTFTIGPSDSPHALITYAKRLEHLNDPEMDAIILGILEGDVRTQCSLLTIEDIFNDRQKFKDIMIRCVQEELDKVGLWIINANIKELQDNKDSNYFHNMSQKKQSATTNQAKIDTAEETKKGETGAKERLRDQRKAIAKFEAEAVIFENERHQEREKSDAELEKVKSEALQTKQIAKVTADNAWRSREAELQKELEQKKMFTETEKLRAIELSKAKVLAEASIERAKGEAMSVQLAADAAFHAKKKEADGMYAVLKAQADGIQELVKSVGHDSNTLIKYLMVERGVYEALAQSNAAAIQGLNPKISIWTTGNSDGKDSAAESVQSIMKMVPPLVDTIEKQTGLTPLDWLTKRATKEADKTD